MVHVKPEGRRIVRAMLLAMLVFGLIGTAVELLFLGHDESVTQVAPLVLIGAGLVVIVWHARVGTPLSLLVMRVTMAAFIAASGIGIGLHYRGNVEFQKETDPSIHGFALFMKAMQSKTPPALAPGILAHLGLLGLVSTFPLLDRRDKA
jgi:hypothetical protein